MVKVVVGVHYREGGALQDRKCSKGDAVRRLEAFHVVEDMRRMLCRGGGGKEEHSTVFYWALRPESEGRMGASVGLALPSSRRS